MQLPLMHWGPGEEGEGQERAVSKTGELEWEEPGRPLLLLQMMRKLQQKRALVLGGVVQCLGNDPDTVSKGQSKTAPVQKDCSA